MSEGAALGEEVLRRLRSAHGIDSREFVSKLVASVTGSPFRALVATILSQNSTDRAAIGAYRSLDELVGVDPYRLAGTDLRRIGRAIRSAGLAEAKSRAIKALAEYASSSGDPDLKRLLSQGPDEARRVLTSFKGIGPKTADVVLATFGVSDTVPVDTHVRRVATRLGLVREGAGYEEARRALDSTFPPSTRHEAHLLLIAHGRRVCRSRRPLCEECVLRDLCAYRSMRRNARKEGRRRLTARRGGGRG